MGDRLLVSAPTGFQSHSVDLGERGPLRRPAGGGLSMGWLWSHASIYEGQEEGACPGEREMGVSASFLTPSAALCSPESQPTGEQSASQGSRSLKLGD